MNRAEAKEAVFSEIFGARCLDRAEAKQALFDEIYGERNNMQVTSETKAVLKTEGTGRVIGFVKSNEPGKISIAVPNDRALMIPAQARQLAAWLISEADKAEKVMTTAARTSEGWRTAEARRQSEIRAALDRDRVGYRRAY